MRHAHPRALVLVLAAIGAASLELATGAGVGALTGCSGGCVHLGGQCASSGGQSNCCNGLVCNFDPTYQQNLCGAPSCTPSGSGQGGSACSAGYLFCGDGLGCCPASTPFTCPGDPTNCYASAADAAAGCGTPCIICGAAGAGGGGGGGGGSGGAGGGGGATASCRLGTTFVQNASGPCPVNSSPCGGNDPLGTNNLPFCGDPNMQCCCGGGGLSYRCWGCGFNEVCGMGTSFGDCCP